MSERYTADTVSTTTLNFRFIHGSVYADPYSVNNVTIHSSYDDAVNDANIIETINSTEITKISIGYYEYTVDILPIAGTYFDKIFVNLTSTGSEASFISVFYVYAPEEIDPDTCTITGTIVSGDGEGMEGVSISATPFDSPALISGTGIALAPSVVSIVTTSTGSFELSLLRNVRFTIHIPEISFKETILVPDLGSTSLWNLTDIFATGEPPVTNPQEENTW
jgi:hypothetical protein